MQKLRMTSRPLISTLRRIRDQLLLKLHSRRVRGHLINFSICAGTSVSSIAGYFLLSSSSPAGANTALLHTYRSLVHLRAIHMHIRVPYLIIISDIFVQFDHIHIL